jgi:CheY-like chemotaxis protein
LPAESGFARLAPCAAPTPSHHLSSLDGESLVPNRANVNSEVTPGSASDKPLILIAEDHSDSREALRALLEAQGYSVETAADGRKAVEKALAVHPDLIIMDIMMPEMDGFEATRRLRAERDFRQVPILALTAMDGARPMVLAAGCDDFLPKPIDVRSFFSRIRSWLETGRAAAE